MLTYIFCLFGALVADGYLGKYKTVVYMYMICIIGNVVLSSAVIKPFGLPSREFSIVGTLVRLKTITKVEIVLTFRTVYYCGWSRGSKRRYTAIRRRSIYTTTARKGSYTVLFYSFFYD